MTKTATVKLRLTPTERTAWGNAAHFHEMRLSEWLRFLANGSAEEAAKQGAQLSLPKTRTAAAVGTKKNAKKAKARR